MIALYDEDSDSLHVDKATDLSMRDLVIPITPALEPLRKGSTVFEPESENLPVILGEDIAAKIKDNAGALFIPMTLERFETVFIGAIIIFKTSAGFLSNEENTLIFETIANHMSPLIAGFKNLEKQQDILIPDTARIFGNTLEFQIDQCKEYDLEMEIVRITDNDAIPYEKSKVPEILADIVEGVYPVSFDRTEILVMNDFEIKYNLIKDSLAGRNITINRLQYSKEFTDMASFLAIK